MVTKAANLCLVTQSPATPVSPANECAPDAARSLWQRSNGRTLPIARVEGRDLACEQLQYCMPFYQTMGSCWPCSP